MSHALSLEQYEQHVNPHWAALLQQLGERPVFIKAKDEFLYDSDDNRWLDFVGHYGASILGHNHDGIQQRLITLIQQALPAGAPLGICTGSAELATRLIKRLGLEGTWKLCSVTTGTEAVEGAVKAALFATARRKILVRGGCFHGNSVFTMHLSDQPAHREGFEALRPAVDIVFFEHSDEALKAIAEGDVAALIVEPVQAMGGGRTFNADEADSVLAACRQHGTISIVDEVFCGLGRCGTYSAMQKLGWSEQPDILLLAKALTGAMIPSAQLLMRTPLFDGLFARPGCQKILGSTFANNNLALSLACSVLELLDSYIMDAKAFSTLDDFGAQLQAYPGRWPDVINGVSCLGACFFIQMKDPDTCFTLWHSLFLNHICTTICPHKPTTLKLIVPLTVDQASLDEFLYVFSELAADLQG
ncbi:aminotransferase class III-fold pyridoxal phosphate-dependent enzyme [Pseudomonas syringae]|uniref:Aminotransferase class III-fold pyridoxal phosphate-dependent enzyme n=3 Tax=Pseudomonas syringae TaxID=317 RepID=A0A9Q4A271_PSESX|nr:aminotransferase class III-fold pyridoxal phosphate-dependent enzyme [Pseudomonas syringae]MCF5469380.1 aminotransferase class III-fold pyridoxal phosphate-dependent enzyme [Pseudomonas syringae]MCF5475656.1 aminotransferase class III-fold pyridoxal phosphate-dependent enzyme [Pseudomonas syringae]MCF5485547.1 aminotransferase class III-fold pyridoxal phosphate-dependent enzyme [Pseudomonas syringae]MCF5490002.1 aminotransferase class III-fold pyridoxal phosphate-dependent enzyme [Pseudomona